MALFRKSRRRGNDSNIISVVENAEKLVNEYGGVLEISSQFNFGAPESLLPQPKEVIKNAIITYLFYLHTIRSLDDHTFEILRAGYMQLATFLDNEEAKLAIVANSAFNSGDPERIATPVVKRAIDRFSKSNEESVKLGIEFDAIAENFGARSLY